MATPSPPRSRRPVVRMGIAMALASALTFGSSGPMAKALIETGWTAGAAVLVRLGGAAVLLILAAVVALRGRLRIEARSARTLVTYGVVAMAGAQLAYFNAVRTLDVGVALLLEFLAPVMLLGWTSVRSRTTPPMPTLVGAALTMVGLAFVLDLAGAGSVDPGGVVWGLLAAVCLCAFFLISNRQHDDLPPLLMAAGGTAVGAAVIAVVGALGVVPLRFATSPTMLAGTTVSWLVPAGWLVLVSTVAAYLTGIGAILRLGTRSASFVALTEVLFAVLVAWALLAELPGLSQLVGGICIVSGIVVIQRTERVTAPLEPEVPLGAGQPT